MFQELKHRCPDPPQRNKKVRKPWISEATIKLMDTRCALRRDPQHDRTASRQLDRQIKSSLHDDRKKRTEEAGEAIETALKEDGFNQKKAYGILKAWYRHCGDRPPKPSRQDLESTANEFQALYSLKEPTGDPIPCQVRQYNIPDHTPTETEIADAVHRLKSNKATGPSQMKPEFFKQWHAEAYPPS
jgi:hypothetical protein